jgi:hypothetical protein
MPSTGLHFASESTLIARDRVIVPVQAPTRLAHDRELRPANVGPFSDPMLLGLLYSPSCGLMDVEYNRGHIET